MKRNVSGLLRYTANLKDNTLEHVNRTIDEMKHNKSKINFRTVAAASGVSTTTLYNSSILRARIESLRAVKEVLPQRSVTTKSAQMREQELRKQIKQLKEEIEMLIVQLLDREQLLEENRRLKALLSLQRRE